MARADTRTASRSSKAPAVFAAFTCGPLALLLKTTLMSVRWCYCCYPHSDGMLTVVLSNNEVTMIHIRAEKMKRPRFPNLSGL